MVFSIVALLNPNQAKPCVLGWLSNGEFATRFDVVSDEVRLGAPGNDASKVARDKNPSAATSAGWPGSPRSARVSQRWGRTRPARTAKGNIATTADGLPCEKAG